MFNTYSMTFVGMAVFTLSLIAKALDLDVDEGRLAEFVNVGGLFIGGLLSWWGQLRRGDLSFGILRK